MLLFDLICYIGLFSLLVFMTRVRPLERVTLSIDGKPWNGVILRCKYGLGSRVGLLNTPRLGSGDGLLLAGVKSIHTRGMHFDLDVLFLDETNRILGTQKNIAPGVKAIKGPSGTRSIVEFSAGSIDQQFGEIKEYAQVEVLPWTPS